MIHHSYSLLLPKICLVRAPSVVPEPDAIIVSASFGSEISTAIVVAHGNDAVALADHFAVKAAERMSMSE